MNRKNRRQHELQQVANQLEEAKKPMEPEKPLRFLEKIEKPVPRPTTPSVKIPDQVEICRLFYLFCCLCSAS